jgi:hypothetical protein
MATTATLSFQYVAATKNPPRVRLPLASAILRGLSYDKLRDSFRINFLLRLKSCKGAYNKALFPRKFFRTFLRLKKQNEPYLFWNADGRQHAPVSERSGESNENH